MEHWEYHSPVDAEGPVYVGWDVGTKVHMAVCRIRIIDGERPVIEHWEVFPLPPLARFEQEVILPRPWAFTDPAITGTGIEQQKPSSKGYAVSWMLHVRSRNPQIISASLKYRLTLIPKTLPTPIRGHATKASKYRWDKQFAVVQCHAYLNEFRDYSPLSIDAAKWDDAADAWILAILRAQEVLKWPMRTGTQAKRRYVDIGGALEE